ncbi:glycosyltransferase [Arenibaculum pallidiluteum]|uniref:glycosyltransferase n=1 Tax=Arenibaculum pallidiluteum TaxID=2812559 RepID=UPI001A95B24D|nr:glycosyltransferase [Arenibaculum pallidiluteum]
MRYLFVHQNFPAQYRQVVQDLVADPANEIVFLTQPNAKTMAGVRKIEYRPELSAPQGMSPYLGPVEPAMRNAEAVWKVAKQLAAEGFRPDLMVGHNAWGEILFLKDVWPDVPLLGLFEFFYRAKGADAGFDLSIAKPRADADARLRIQNTVNLLGLDAADWGHCATHWQRRQYPRVHRSRISVIHEGIDTAAVRPNPGIRVNLAGAGRVLTPEDEVITYVSRSLEPYRGFHIFMRSLPEILRRRPAATVIVIGGDDVSYGGALSDGRTFRQALTEELGPRLDISRVHFLGRVPFEQYLAVLQLSSVHIYLTYPFVLSWSMIEAMSAGCMVVGSATPPVQEVIADGVNGLLVDFFSTTQIADAVDRVLDHPNRMRAQREAARRTAVLRFDAKTISVPRFRALFDALIEGRQPETYVDPRLDLLVGGDGA